MALEGKCSTEQVNGQTSTPIENTTCTVMRRQTLRTLFFISKHHPYICKDSMTDFSNSDKNPQAMSLLAISSEGWQSKHRDKKNHTCRSSDVIQIAEKHPSLWAQQTTAPHSPLQPAAVTEQGCAHPGELSALEGCWAQPSTPRCHPWLFRAPALLYLSFT